MLTSLLKQILPQPHQRGVALQGIRKSFSSCIADAVAPKPGENKGWEHICGKCRDNKMDSRGCCSKVLPQILQGLVHFQPLRQLLCSFCCYIIVAQTVKKMLLVLPKVN